MALEIWAAFPGLTPVRPFSMSHRLATDTPINLPNSLRLISSVVLHVRMNPPTVRGPRRFSKSFSSKTRFLLVMLVHLQDLDEL